MEKNWLRQWRIYRHRIQTCPEVMLQHVTKLLPDVVEHMNELLEMHNALPLDGADSSSRRKSLSKALREGALLLCNVELLNQEEASTWAEYQRRLFQLVERAVVQTVQSTKSIAVHLVRLLLITCRRFKGDSLFNNFTDIPVACARWLRGADLSSSEKYSYLQLIRKSVQFEPRTVSLSLINFKCASKLAQYYPDETDKCRVVIAKILLVLCQSTEGRRWKSQLNDNNFIVTVLKDVALCRDNAPSTCTKRSLWLYAEKLLIALVGQEEVRIEASKHGAVEYFHDRCVGATNKRQYVHSLSLFAYNCFTRVKLRRGTALDFLAGYFERSNSETDDAELLRAFVCFKYDEVGLSSLLRRQDFRQKLLGCLEAYLAARESLENRQSLEGQPTSRTACPQCSLQERRNFDNLPVVPNALVTAMSNSIAMITCIAHRKELSACLCTKETCGVLLSLMAATVHQNNGPLFNLLKYIISNCTNLEQLIMCGICTMIYKYLIVAPRACRNLRRTGYDLLSIIRAHDLNCFYATKTALNIHRYGNKDQQFRAACFLAFMQNSIVRDQYFVDVVDTVCAHLGEEEERVEMAFAALTTLCAPEAPVLEVFCASNVRKTPCRFPSQVAKEDRVHFCSSDEQVVLTASCQVLCDKSEFYRAMLIGGFMESGSRKFYLPDEPNVSKAVVGQLHWLHGCLYCRQMKCRSADECFEMVQTSLIQLCPSFTEHLVDHVVERWLDTSSIVNFMQLATLHGYCRLFDKCLTHMMKRSLTNGQFATDAMATIKANNFLADTVVEIKKFFAGQTRLRCARIYIGECTTY